MSTARTVNRPSGAVGTPQPRRNFLAEIKSEVARRPLAAILYGVPGIGKTSMAAHAPGAVFLTDPKEDGITTLKNYGRVPMNVPQITAADWGEALEIVDSLATGEHSHKTLVLDALGGFERLCHAEVCRRDFKNDWGKEGFMSFHKGYDVSVTDWLLMLTALDRVRARGMNLILLAHSNVKTFHNPEGDDYDRYLPDVHEKTWKVTHKWVDMVLFMNYVTVVDKDGKAKGGQDRILMTEYHPAFDAKNRLGLPQDIDMGASGLEAWTNFAAAVKAQLAEKVS